MAKTTQRLERERQRSIRNNIIITDPSKCFVCRSTGLTETDKFCPNCGFPQRGTKEEQKRFIYLINNKKQVLEEQRGKIRKATTVLFILGAINAAIGILIAFLPSKNLPLMISCIICAAIYFALGFWSQKNPFPAILSGFFVYITFIAIGAIGDPASIFSGLIWKFLIISALVYGYKAVKDSKALEEELQSVQKARALNIESVNIEEANNQN